MTNGGLRPTVAHALAAIAFALLALAWTFPLVLHLSTHIPGAGPSDNATFLWNLWWWRHALHSHVDPFYTNYLFYPLGVDLTQHSHTALNGLLAATVLAPLSLVAAQNVLLIAWVFLNGFVAYLLAHRISHHHVAALCAGIVFAGCPAVLVRLEGHFNLVAAWVLPMSFLLTLRALASTRTRAYAAAGIGWAVAAYCDYYYLVYALVCVTLLVADRWLAATARASRREATRLSTCVAALLGIDLILMLFVSLSGGTEWRLGTVVVSMHTTFNLRIAFWMLVACWGISRWRVSIGLSLRQSRASVASDVRGLAVAFLAFALFTVPLAYHAVRLFVNGDYASQRYLWRSAPAGVDLGSVLLGNPLHFLSGSLTQGAYAALGMNTVEGIGWLGILAPALIITGWRRLRPTPEARFWRLALVVFGLWALGPLLNVFGTTPGIVLPAAFLRLVPVGSNVRIPGRAVIVVALAMSALVALSLAKRMGRWPLAGSALVVAALVLECTPGPWPLYEVERNGVYALLARSHDGAVLELPLGLRDGFGESGSLDHRTLIYQTVSDRPMLGGFVARLPDRVKEWYRHEPVIATLLLLSDPASPAASTPPLTPPRETYQALSRLRIRYIVLNRRAASPELVRYVEATIPLRLVTQDGDRQLFELQDPR